MAPNSERLHAVRDIHQHEDPPLDSERTALPDTRGEANDSDANQPGGGRLWREEGKVLYQGDPDTPPQSVRVLWARPLSNRGGNGPVSIMLSGKKKEVAFFASLGELPEDSRRIAREELAAGAVLPRITVIHRVTPRFGNYYWDVETTMGRRKFLLSSPENNSLRPNVDVIVVRDVSGNCYEITPVSGLSSASRTELDRVL